MSFPTLTVTLAGNDVSAYATGQLSVTRGRVRQVDQYQAATASIALRNEDRRFDPSNSSGPYYPQPLPRAALVLSLAGNQIFNGYVSDYDMDYRMPSTAETKVSAMDAFSILATSTLTDYSAVQQTSGQRISAVLSQVGYSGATAIDTGQSLLQASTVTSVTALDHCRVAAASEDGMFFVNRTGAVQFQDRLFPLQQAATYPNGQMTITDTGVSYAGPVVGYKAISITSAVALLYNICNGQRTDGEVQTATDAVSVAAYLPRTLSLPTVENWADADVLDICNWYVLKYSAPEVRFGSVVIELAGLAGTIQAALSALDIGSVVIAERTPPGGGSKITQLSMVEGMTWGYDASNRSCTLTLSLTNITTNQYFALDDAVHGILDTSILFY